MLFRVSLHEVDDGLKDARGTGLLFVPALLFGGGGAQYLYGNGRHLEHTDQLAGVSQENLTGCCTHYSPSRVFLCVMKDEGSVVKVAVETRVL